MKQNLVITFILLLFFNCSSDDDISNINGLVDTTVIAFKDDAVYQINILNNGNSLEEINLTNTLGVPVSVSFFNESEGLLTFYRDTGNSYEVYQKNLSTETTEYVTEQLCVLGTNEGSFSASNSQEKLIHLTNFFNDGMYFSRIKTLDKQTGNCVSLDLPIGNTNFIFTTAITDGEYAYIKQDLNPNMLRVSRINLINNTIEAELDLDSNFASTVYEDKLYIIDDNIVTTYNAADFQLIDTNPFTIPILSNWFKTQVLNNEMLIDLPYAQPGVLSDGPATVDLSLGNLAKGNDGFFFDVRNTLSNTLGMPVNISTYTTDLSTGRIVFGYFTDAFQSSGGVAQTNFEGELIGYTELDYIPSRIILN